MNRGRVKFYFKIFLAAIFLSLISGYSFYQSRSLVIGPIVTISEPKNGETVNQSLIKIAGDSKNIKKITLDDREINIDETGAFSEKLLLSEGYNIIKVSAWDKFGKKTEKTIEVVYGGKILGGGKRTED
ncbi:MAG: hypothetical protein KGJ58_01535 [Patescibacteria group bacterium]|nr:hypothetical protein [Patescibacteria group bacterium]MDE1988513.1 hypothetical protein [Patescibacteria group bacterium]MDE2218120.1 hypothetical protein [Patescibacteria group bacterium]